MSSKSIQPVGGSEPRSNTGGDARHHSHRSTVPSSYSQSLYVKVKFNNTLPDIPFDPKFLINPLNLSRFVQYEPTSLERNSKHELLVPPDLGVDIDLIDPDKHKLPTGPIVHHLEDEYLLADDENQVSGSAKKNPRDKQHSQLHNKVVPWLKKTEYISTEYNRYGSSSEKTETKVGYNVRKNMNENLFMDRESQIKAIEKTFEESQKPIVKHHSKSGVTAKRVMPLLPDFKLWKYHFAQAVFENEPVGPDKTDAMSQAVIRGAVDQETKEQFVIYFLPTEVTMADKLMDQQKGVEFTEGKEYEYKPNREYTWNAKTNDEDFYFFNIRDDQVHYNKLLSLARLNKRRAKTQSQITNSTLMTTYRALNEQETQAQQVRLVDLEKAQIVEQTGDLTAQDLEQSYEDKNTSADDEEDETTTTKNQDERSSIDDEDDDDNEDEDDDKSQSSSSKASSSIATSSSMSDASDDEDDESDHP